jgi:4-amino-4-deoxy-L-arabinose transferase-like glycosyltransferase
MTASTEMDRITAPLGRTEAFLAVLLTWVALYLPGLGATELHGEEGRRILPAVTMLQTGDWLVPRVGGEAYCSKPPFINWLVAGSFLLTGRQDEFSARLPSALFVLAFVALLVWFPGDWPRIEARLIAAVVFLTSYGVLKKGHQIEIEAVYVSLIAMALLTWLGLWVRGISRWALWLVPSVFLTCGMLTKGPPILLFYYAPVVGILAYSRRLRTLLSIPHLASLVPCLGLPAAWAYLAARHAADQGLAVTQLSEAVVRLLPVGIDWSEWATEVLRSFVNPLPWLVFLPLLWRRDFTGHIPPSRLPVLRGARLGLVVSFLAITLIPGNSGRYSMPAIGLESLLLGWVLAEVGALPDEGRLWRSSALAGYALAVPLAAVGLVGIRTDLWAVVILGAAACLTIVLLRRRGLFRTPVQLTLLSALLGVVLMLEYALFVPRAHGRAEERRPVAATVASFLPPAEPLYLYRPGCLDFLFYLGRPIEYLLEPSQIDSRIRFLLLPEPAYRQLQEPPAAVQLGRTLYRFTFRHYGDFRLLDLSCPQAGRANVVETPATENRSLPNDDGVAPAGRN